ncbi:ABC transporter ATP-binding protein [Microbacterium aquimaris]|uniref:ABC transporter ATP-binding protein n=1 Tax=Microbacterium aquimaris TaxID=459816 RepID=UPI002AD51953|nr:ABC transporter ATP-binding protein [Microbacterium aquimaris]MDZ8274849.1 ABC transporter ATP-binding protein [Microbacterium aquimaris]
MSRVDLQSVVKTFGERTVIEPIDLTVDEGSFTVLVGPSGCGKSTTLRMIAGLEQPTGGRIGIGGRDVTSLPPGERGVAMVFQNYAIYPTMNVERNIEYGLKNTGVAKAERRELVEEIAETVGLTDHLRKSPDQLSGGERQRVALARAMVRKPDVFLMDEPLSNLDARLRQHMRAELVDLHARLGATFIYVTHDQVEAMSMGSRIVLMDKGRIMQDASPLELYTRPANTFAARFIGSPPMNVIAADQLTPAAAPDAHFAGFRPEHARVAPWGEATAPGWVRLEGTSVASEYLGAETVDRVRLDSGEPVSVRGFDGHRPLARGPVAVHVPDARLHWFDASQARIDVAQERIPEAVASSQVPVGSPA